MNENINGGYLQDSLHEILLLWVVIVTKDSEQIVDMVYNRVILHVPSTK